MNLSDIDCDTAELAGALLNLGKLLVPAQLLTKQGALDEAEIKVVRDSLLASADIMGRIEFEGPVVETMRQSMEKVDGSGFPKGLSGDEILLTARIVGVANSFVALISQRAHRSGLSVDIAIKTLMEQVDKAWDRGVVAALVSYLENKGGHAEWDLVAPVPEDEKPAEDNPWQR
jgi:HD-GYP domain-containing protein (c-di-GMP phosphodiesterase class II)